MKLYWGLGNCCPRGVDMCIDDSLCVVLISFRKTHAHLLTLTALKSVVKSYYQGKDEGNTRILRHPLVHQKLRQN